MLSGGTVVVGIVFVGIGFFVFIIIDVVVAIVFARDVGDGFVGVAGFGFVFMVAAGAAVDVDAGVDNCLSAALTVAFALCGSCASDIVVVAFCESRVAFGAAPAMPVNQTLSAHSVPQMPRKITGPQASGWLMHHSRMTLLAAVQLSSRDLPSPSTNAEIILLVIGFLCGNSSL